LTGLEVMKHPRSANGLAPAFEKQKCRIFDENTAL
jgi:hypothetical protein